MARPVPGACGNIAILSSLLTLTRLTCHINWISVIDMWAPMNRWGMGDQETRRLDREESVGGLSQRFR